MMDSNSTITPTDPKDCGSAGKSQWCSAVNCKNSRTQYWISFFRFPRDAQRSKQWVLNCRRTDLLTKTTKELFVSNVLCQEHFELDQFNNPNKNRLTPSAVPTMFDFGSGLMPQTCETAAPVVSDKQIIRKFVKETSSNVKRIKRQCTDTDSNSEGKELSVPKKGKSQQRKPTHAHPMVKTGKWFAKHGPGLSKAQIDASFHSPKDIEKDYLFNCLHSAVAVCFEEEPGNKAPHEVVANNDSSDNPILKSNIKTEESFADSERLLL